MNTLAMWIGYAVMALGGLCLVGVAAWCVTEFLWDQVKRVRGVHNIRRAFEALESQKGNIT